VGDLIPKDLIFKGSVSEDSVSVDLVSGTSSEVVSEGLGSSERSSLLSKVYVGKSSIHGQGLFARIRIPAGEMIGRFEGVETDQDGQYVLWIQQSGSRYLGIEGTTELRFVNHSRSPNAEFEDDVLVALRPIRPGDEITCDYGESWSEKHR
jgi:uncharacterized protein